MGFVEFVSAVSVFALLLIPLEINQAMARLLPENEDLVWRRDLIYSALAFTAWAFFAASMLIFALRYQILAISGIPPTYVQYMSLVLVHFAVLAWIAVLQVQFRFLDNAVAAVTMNVAIIAANLIFTIYLSIDGLVLTEYFYSQIASNFMGAVLATVFIWRRLGRPYLFPRRLVTHEMLSYSLPILVSSFGVALSLGLDRVLVARYAGLTDLGYYGVAAKFGAIAAIMLNVASSAMTPVVYRAHTDPATRVLIERLFHITIVCCIGVMIILTFFASDLVRFIAGDNFLPSGNYVFFLLLAATLSNLYIFFMGIDVAKNTRLIGRINLSMGIFSAVLSVSLIPRIGVWGAIISAVAAAALRLGLYIHFSQKLYRLKVALTLPFACMAVLTLYNMINVWKLQ